MGTAITQNEKPSVLSILSPLGEFVVSSIGAFSENLSVMVFFDKVQTGSGQPKADMELVIHKSTFYRL